MKNVALLGFGKMGKKFYQRSILSKKIYIDKILKKKLIKNKKIKFFNDINKLVKNKKIQGYIVATPVQNHFRHIKSIIKTNKPIIIEKPLVAKLTELKKLYNLLKNYKKSIFVNHKDLYNPAFIKFSKQIKNIGYYSKINIFFGKYQKIKIYNKKFTFLPSFDWLPHPIAIAIKLNGVPNKIKIIQNDVFIKNKNIFQNSKIIFLYDKAIIQINFSNRYKTPKRRVVINGTKSTIIYDGSQKNMLTKKIKNSKTKKIKYYQIDPLDYLINKFYFSMKNKFYNNDIHLSYNVMKILFEIEKKMKIKLNL